MKRVSFFTGLVGFGFFCWLSFPLSAQKSEPTPEAPPFSGKMLNPESLWDDFKVFRTTLEEAHPNLYRYTSKERLNHLMDSICLDLDEARSEKEFYKKLAFLVAQIKDGHTSIQPSAGYLSQMKILFPLFPFYLIFIDERAFVLINASEEEDIGIGSELLSINGKTMPEILAEMYLICRQMVTTKPVKSGC